MDRSGRAISNKVETNGRQRVAGRVEARVDWRGAIILADTAVQGGRVAGW